jgi:hypothetical protein
MNLYRNNITIGDIPQLDVVVPSFFPKTGLVAYYKMDEASGTTLTDALGSYNGSLTNVTVNQTGKIGKSHLYNGSSSYGSIAGIPQFNQDFSISCWVKRGGIGTDDFIFGRGTTTSKDRALHLGFRENNILTMAFYGDDLNTVTKYTDTSNWHHIVWTYNYTTKEKKIYYDNILVASGIGTGNPNFGTANLILGNAPFSSGLFFAGNIDEVGVWVNHILTSDEITQLYNNGNGLTY